MMLFYIHAYFSSQFSYWLTPPPAQPLLHSSYQLLLPSSIIHWTYIMMTTEETKDLFADATAAFPSITGAPTDDDDKRIREVLIKLLHSIDVPGVRQRFRPP